MWTGRGKTAVVGVGFSELTRNTETSLGRLALDACHAAIADAGLRTVAIDGVCTYPDQPFQGAGSRDGVDLISAVYVINHMNLAPEIGWYAQISNGMIPSTLVEGCNALLAGVCNYVLVWRALHQPKGAYGAWRATTAAGDSQFTAPYGFANVFQVHAAAYRRYMEEYGATREQMATLVTNSRHNANLNEKAYFYRTPMTREDYLNARMIADPLCLFDCDIPVEGCAALVLTTAERAQDLRHPPAYIAGYGQHTARRPTLPVYMLDDYMACGASTANKMWQRAGLGPADVNVAQLYDGFSPSTYYWLEAAGFCPRGEAARFVQGGRIALSGELPVNTFGGSLSEGRLHGMGHLAEAVYQVTGRAGPRQAPGANVAVAIDGSPLLRGAGIVFTSAPG